MTFLVSGKHNMHC